MTACSIIKEIMYGRDWPEIEVEINGLLYPDGHELSNSVQALGVLIIKRRYYQIPDGPVEEALQKLIDSGIRVPSGLVEFAHTSELKYMALGAQAVRESQMLLTILKQVLS